MSAELPSSLSDDLNLPGLVKVRLVKDQEIFVLFTETLDGMRSALGEVPNIAIVELLDLIPAELIHSGDQDGAIVDDSPFSLKTC